MRSLMALHPVAPSTSIQTFIENNADSILASDESGSIAFGALWQGPSDSADSTRKTSALDAIIAEIAVQAH